MAKRKTLSQALRFEVFKRDSFTCQYCGAKAPNAVLHVDHIKPVAEGGTNELLNLVTACVACNLGKGAKRLDDRSAVQRQRAQIEDLEARREQLEMMLAWRDQAEAEKVDAVQAVATRIAQRAVFEPNERGRQDIRRWLKEFSLAEVLAAMDGAFDAYLVWVGDEPTDEIWGKSFRAIGGFARNNREMLSRPYLPRLLYVQGILRRSFDDPTGGYLQYLEDAVERFDSDAEWMVDVAKRSTDWKAFLHAVYDEAATRLGGEEVRRRIDASLGPSSP